MQTPLQTDNGRYNHRPHETDLTQAAIDGLPRRIRLRLDQTLSQWRRWQCDPLLDAGPLPCEVLDGGVSNFSVLVGNSRRFVVRIDGIDATANGLHRQLEWRALQAAQHAGLAPAPRYFNPDLGCLVCDYLPPDQDQAPRLAEIGKLLRRIHELPPLHHRLDLADRLNRLEKMLQRQKGPAPEILTELRKPVVSLVKQLQTTDRDTTLCHNDLLAANRLRSGGTLWALDWEYCAMGSPWYDLAVTVCGDELNADEIDQLLLGYLGRAPLTIESNLVAEYAGIYRYLELLWYLALNKKPGDTLLKARAAGLAAAWQTR